MLLEKANHYTLTLEATFLTIPAAYPLSRRVVATTEAVVATIDRIVA